MDFRFHSLQAISIALILFLLGCRGTDKPAEDIPDSTSVESLSKLIRENPKNAHLFFLRAGQNARQGLFEEAIPDVQIAIRLDSLKPEYPITLAEYFLRVGKSAESNKMLVEATKRFPYHPEAFIKLGELLLFVQDYKNSMESILKAQRISPDNPEVFFIKGMIYKEMGDTIRAISNFQQSIDQDPEFFKAFMEIGALHAKNKNSLAVDYFKTAIRLQPTSIEAHYFLGMFFQENRKSKEALASYQELVEKADPNYVHAWYNMGYVYLVQLSDFDEAIRCFSRVVELKPGYFQAWYNRGLAFEKKGEFVKARADYEKALQWLPNYDLAVDGLNRLDNLRKK